MQTSMPVNKVVPLDELHVSALAHETALDGFFLPGLGWFCLLMAGLDLIGNVLGIPWITAAILKNSDAAPSGGILWLVVLTQISFAIAGLVCLHFSPWRRWLELAIAELKELDFERRFFSGSLFRRAAISWERMVQAQPTGNGQPSKEWSLFIMKCAWLSSLLAVASLNLFNSTGWAVLIVAAVSLTSRQFTGLIRLIGRRMFSDQSTLTGALLAVALGLGVLTLFTLPRGWVGSFLASLASDSEYRHFRAVELFVLTCLLSWFGLLPGSRLNNELLIHVSAPRSRDKVCYDLGSFLTFRGRRVIAHLSSIELRDVIVLMRTESGGFQSVPAAQPLELNRHSYLIVHLASLIDLTQRREIRELNLLDRRGYFQIRGDVVAGPRPFEESQSLIEFPPQALDRILGLLSSRGLTGELNRLCQDAVDNFVESLQASGQEFDASVNRLEGKVDDIAWRIHSGVEVHGELVSLENAQVVTGLTELQRKQDALQHVQDCRQEGEILLQQWLAISECWRCATFRVSSIFSELFHQRYVGPHPLAQLLMDHCGIELRLRVKPASGHNGLRSQLLERLNLRLREIRDIVIQDIDRRQTQLMTILSSQLSLRSQREQMVLQSLFLVLPQMLPWFRGCPDELLRLLEFAVRHAHEPAQANRLLLQLGQQARKTTHA